MLTPENLQLHSEAAALLLIWAANMIKAYACYKKLGLHQAQDPGETLKMDQYPVISKNTKVMLHKTYEETSKAAKEFSKNAVKVKQVGITPVQLIKNEKGIFGQFLPAKQVVFNDQQQTMHPDYVNELR